MKEETKFQKASITELTKIVNAMINVIVSVQPNSAAQNILDKALLELEKRSQATVSDDIPERPISKPQTPMTNIHGIGAYK